MKHQIAKKIEKTAAPKTIEHPLKRKLIHLKPGTKAEMTNYLLEQHPELGK